MKQFLTIAFLFCCIAWVAPLSAQPQTVQATVVSGASSEHLYVAIGQPFFTQETLGNYELSMGMAQAQWTRDTVYDVITYNTDYTENGFNLHDQTESHKDSVYLVNGGIYHYDLRRTLYLIVCPESLADILENNLLYDVVAVSGHCWTKQNLRTPVEGATAYQSSLNTEVPVVYGLLYTLNAAQNNTTPDEEGYVQGICPTKWHLPDATEIADLSTNPVTSLRSIDGWVNGESNTNSTGFTAYPAGRYNSTLGRFEGLGTETYWWTTANAGTFGMATEGTSTSVGANNYSSLLIDYFCDTPRLTQCNPNDKLSVRCVMKNEWPE